MIFKVPQVLHHTSTFYSKCKKSKRGALTPVRDGHSVDSVSRRSNLGELTWLETPQTYPRARATARSSKRARAFIILGWSQAASASASASASARGEREEVSASVACNDDDGEYPSRQNARRAKNPACSSKQHEDGRKQGRETDLPTKPLAEARNTNSRDTGRYLEIFSSTELDVQS